MKGIKGPTDDGDGQWNARLEFQYGREAGKMAVCSLHRLQRPGKVVDAGSRMQANGAMKRPSRLRGSLRANRNPIHQSIAVPFFYLEGQNRSTPTVPFHQGYDQSKQDF